MTMPAANPNSEAGTNTWFGDAGLEAALDDADMTAAGLKLPEA